MAKLSAQEIEKMIHGLKKVVRKLEERTDIESVDTYSYKSDALGVTSFKEDELIGVHEYTKKFENLFGFKPSSFSGESYDRGLTNLQKLLTSNFISAGTLPKKKWILFANHTIEILAAKLEKRLQVVHSLG